MAMKKYRGNDRSILKKELSLAEGVTVRDALTDGPPTRKLSNRGKFFPATALNIYTHGDILKIVVSAVTAFTEGRVQIGQWTTSK